MPKEENKKSKTAPLYFKRKDGRDTPILSKKANVEEEKFLDQLEASGYEGIKSFTPKHFTDNGMALHVGERDGCRYCAKLVKATKPTEIDSAIENPVDVKSDLKESVPLDESDAPRKRGRPRKRKAEE
jgi:hypothetical protein